MRRSVFILSVAIALASCKGSNKVATVDDSGNITRKKTACSKLHVDMNKPHLDWYEADKSILNKSNEILVLPKDYKVYTIDTAQAREFFSALQNGQILNTAVPLPAPADCQLFTVKKHRFKNEQKNIAGAVMAKGDSKGQELVIGFYQNMIEANVNWFDIEYEIKAKKIQGIPYMIVYTKMPPPVQNTDQKAKERPQLKIVERKYDK